MTNERPKTCIEADGARAKSGDIAAPKWNPDPTASRGPTSLVAAEKLKTSLASVYWIEIL